MSSKMNNGGIYAPNSSHSNYSDLCSHYESFVEDISPFQAKGMLPELPPRLAWWMEGVEGEDN